MKKYIIAILTFLFLATIPAKAANWGNIGVSLMVGEFDTSGSESEKSGNVGPETNSTTVTEQFAGASVFYELDIGPLTFGIDYVPTSVSLGDGKRTDASTDADVASEADTGDRSASAEANDIMALYVNVPVGPVYAHLGYFEADIETTESLPNSTYGNKSVDGYQLGVGMEINDNAKVEFMYTDIDEFTLTSTSGSSSVTADPEIMTLRLKYTFGG